MIPITNDILISESEIHETFIRSSGPGGQNINKVATAVQLRFNVSQSPSLPEYVKQQLLKLAGNRINAKGILIIDARRYRTQSAKRDDAMKRLISLIRKEQLSRPSRE